MKKCSNALIIRKMKTWKALMYHFSPIRFNFFFFILKYGTLCWELGENRHSYIIGENANQYSLSGGELNNMWEKYSCPYPLSNNPTSKNLPWKYTSNSKKHIHARLLTTALFLIAKYWRQPKCPYVQDQLKKWWYITQWRPMQL